MVVDEDRGSQEVTGSQQERYEQQRLQDFLAVRATAKAIASCAPLLLQGMANDLLHAVISGGAAKRYVALELASLAYIDIEPLPLMGPEREKARPCTFPRVSDFQSVTNW